MDDLDRNAGNSNLQRNENSVRPHRRWMFRLFAIAFPFIILLAIECLMRFGGSGTSQDPYINISPFTIFSRSNIDGREHYRITHHCAYAKRRTNIHFATEKPPGTIRVFCIGGSACAGWPHPETEIFSQYLEQSLSNAFPDRPIEVINAAAHGFASYRIRHILDDIIDLDPDAIVIYSGNNEFHERRQYDISYVDLADQLGKRMRTVQWLQAKLRNPPAVLDGNNLYDSAGTFYKRIQRESLELRSDPQLFRRVVQHYQQSIQHMVDQAGRRDIPVVLVTVPVNLRDWLPHVSHNQLKGPHRESWKKLYRQARKHYLAGEFDEGIRIMKQAIEVEPEHAESYFWLGRLHEAADNTPLALESYRRAKDLDYNPFRAHSEFNKIVRDIAGQNPHVTLVDLANEFPRASKNGLPGFDLFLDYVHPSQQGNILIAKQIFHSLVEEGMIQGNPTTSEFVLSDEPMPGTKEPYNDSTYWPLQVRLFNMYAQNHQHDAAAKQAIHLHQLLTGTDEEPEELDLGVPANMREGYKVFQNYLQTERQDLLGLLPNDDKMKQAESQRRQFYERWFPYGSF